MKCPTCGEPAEWKANKWRPFCSERCQLIDFGHWADEDYRIPDENSPTTAPSDDEEGDVGEMPLHARRTNS